MDRIGGNRCTDSSPCSDGGVESPIGGIPSRLSAVIHQLQQCQGELERGGDLVQALGSLMTAHSDLGLLSTMIAESGKVQRFRQPPGPSGALSLA